MHNEKRTVRTLSALSKKLKTHNRNISRKRREGPKLVIIKTLERWVGLITIGLLM